MHIFVEFMVYGNWYVLTLDLMDLYFDILYFFSVVATSVEINPMASLLVPGME